MGHAGLHQHNNTLIALVTELFQKTTFTQWGRMQNNGIQRVCRVRPRGPLVWRSQLSDGASTAWKHWTAGQCRVVLYSRAPPHHADTCRWVKGTQEGGAGDEMDDLVRRRRDISPVILSAIRHGNPLPPVQFSGPPTKRNLLLCYMLLSQLPPCVFDVQDPFFHCSSSHNIFVSLICVELF